MEIKGRHIGYFATKVEAAAAYARALLTPPARLQQHPAPLEPRSTPARDSRTIAPSSESAVSPRPKRAALPRAEPQLQSHNQSPPRAEADAPAGRGGRAKRAKRCTRYDNLPREGTDSEGHVWALIFDPRAEGAHYNGFDGTGYKGVSEDGWFGPRYNGVLKTHPFLVKEGSRIIRFKTMAEAAVAYARLQAGLPASLEEEEDADEQDAVDDEAEERGLTDAKLWEGAAAAGWKAHAKSGKRGADEYTDPNGQVLKSKRSAVKAEAEGTRRAVTEAKAEGTRGGGVAKRKRGPTPKAAPKAAAESTSPLVAMETEMGSPRERQ